MTDQSRDFRACYSRTGATRRHLQLTLPTTGLPVALARQVARDVLTAWRLAHVEETAVLLVSELATNAVRDATSTDEITLELQVVEGWLRIEAYRCRPGQALPRTTGEFDESGYEYALMNALSDKWGVRETVHGKSAWAELDVRDQPGSPMC